MRFFFPYVVGFISTMMAFSVSAGYSDLKIVKGKASHDPSNSTPPPLRSELIKKAHQEALKNLGNADNFMQVSQWADEVDCEPVYNGSPNCYRGSVSSEASFIAKNDIDDIWRIETRSSSLCGYANLEREALTRARFFCGGDVILPPVRQRSGSNPGIENEFYCWYEATYECVKTRRQ